MAGASIRLGWRITSDGFRFANDSIPAVIWASTLWFVLGFAPTMFWFYTLSAATIPPQRLAIAVLWGLTASLLLGPATVAAQELLARAKRREDVGFKAYFQGFAQHYRRAAGTGGAMALIGLVIVTDVIYFLQAPWPLVRLLSVVWLYFIAFWLLMAIYVAPLIVWQPDTSVLTVLKRAALLVLDNLVVTLMLAIVIGLWLFVSFLLRVPIFLFFMGTVAALTTVGIEQLLSRYLAPPEPPKPSEDGRTS